MEKNKWEGHEDWLREKHLRESNREQLIDLIKLQKKHFNTLAYISILGFVLIGAASMGALSFMEHKINTEYMTEKTTSAIARELCDLKYGEDVLNVNAYPDYVEVSCEQETLRFPR